MSNPVVVHKGRTNVVTVNLGLDISNDVLTSDIRVDKKRTSQLIATWDITLVNDGVDGEIRLTLDDAVTSIITEEIGYMDIKRVSNGEPFSVFFTPLEVNFREVITP